MTGVYTGNTLTVTYGEDQTGRWRTSRLIRSSSFKVMVVEAPT